MRAAGLADGGWLAGAIPAIIRKIRELLSLAGGICNVSRARPSNK